MFNFIAVMFVGLLLGYLLRKVDALQQLARPIAYTIFLLLFLMGVGVGGNPDLLRGLSTLGVTALYIASACTFLSVLFGWLVWRYVFKEGNSR